MLASAATQLFISSCAVAIYPAASADKSTISHQQRWGGGVGSNHYTQSSALHCFSLMHTDRAAGPLLRNQPFPDWWMMRKLPSIHLGFVYNLFHFIHLSHRRHIHLVWDQTFLKKCTCFSLFSSSQNIKSKLLGGKKGKKSHREPNPTSQNTSRRTAVPLAPKPVFSL